MRREFKISLSAVLAAVFVIFSTLASANPAFLPLITGVTFHTFLGVATFIEMYQDAPKPQSAIGQSALSVTISDPANPANAVRVPTTSSPSSAAAIPAPAATSPPPSPESKIIYYGAASFSVITAQGCSTGDSCTFDAQVSRLNADVSSQNSAYTIISAGAPNITLRWMDEFRQTIATSSMALSACASGYVLVSGSCVLSEPRLAVPDGKTDYLRSGTALSKVPDVDVPFNGGYLQSTANPNDTIVFNGQSSSGDPRKLSVQSLASGGSTVEIQTQKVDSANRTYLETTTYQVNSAGTVQSAGTSTSGQQLAVNATGTGYDTVTGTASTFAPSTGNPEGTGTNPCGGPGQPPCGVTLSSGDMGPINDLGTGNKSPLDEFADGQVGKVGAWGANDPGAGSQTALKNDWSSVFDAIPVTGCSPLSLNVGGKPFVLDHCAKAILIGEILGYVMWIGLLIGSLVLVTGGRDANARGV